MWLFIFTELLLFGGLFIVYSVYRFMNQDAFHLAAEELNTTIGAINTVWNNMMFFFRHIFAF